MDALLTGLTLMGTPGGMAAVGLVIWLADLFFNDDDPGGPGYGW